MHISLVDTDNHWAWGSRILSSCLKKQGHQVRLLCMCTANRSYSARELEQLRYLTADSAVIGLSCCSGGSERARQVLETIKSPGQFTVWGGIHATLNPEECAGFADVVCLGEGEGMMSDLVQQIEDQRDWKTVLNAAYKIDGHLIKNPIRPLLGNMDELPPLDFSGADEFHLYDGEITRTTDLTDLALEEIPFISSRGCVFRCTYCCNAKLKQVYSGAGYYVRKHSISECVNRIAALHDHHFPRAKYIFFVDDDFLDRKNAELQQFAEIFPQRVGLPFECNVSPLRVNPERIEHLVKAGVWRIRMGVESGSERTKREIYDRAMPNTAVMRASEVLSKHPHVVRAYYFIIGNPFEEREDLLETIQLVLKLPVPFFVQVFNLIFFPGSSLYDRGIEAGLIRGKSDSGYDLQYRGGLHYDRHAWKMKNLYLNGLMFMMEGKITRTRLGALPRFIVPLLLSPSFVAFNERHLWLAKAMIWIKMQFLKVRTKVGTTVKRVFPHPEAIYTPGTFIKNSFRRMFAHVRS
jgi:anaerobic magnesium-protoporphyrin IX monomethyl ester cyclase